MALPAPPRWAPAVAAPRAPLRTIMSTRACRGRGGAAATRGGYASFSGRRGAGHDECCSYQRVTSLRGCRGTKAMSVRPHARAAAVADDGVDGGEAALEEGTFFEEEEGAFMEEEDEGTRGEEEEGGAGGEGRGARGEEEEESGDGAESEAPPTPPPVFRTGGRGRLNKRMPAPWGLASAPPNAEQAAELMNRKTKQQQTLRAGLAQQLTGMAALSESSTLAQWRQGRGLKLVFFFSSSSSQVFRS